MSELASSIIEKVSSYNFFNYLFTGAIFLVGVDRIAATQNTTLPILAFVLIAYFLGLVLSRIGSLLLEPILRKVRFVKYTAYSDFLAAERNDSKIATLLEVNNTYRTLAALFLVLVGVKIAVVLKSKYPNLQPYIEWSWPFVLSLLFAFAYRKQTQFIYKRVTDSKAGTKGGKSG